MKWKALIIEPVHPVLLSTLNELHYEYTLVKSISKEEALAMIAPYHGIITSNKLYIDREIIDAGPLLKWIGRMGSGMEIIDVAYAKSKNIACLNSPDGNANAVAEQALGMYLALKHNIVKSHVQLMQDVWQRDENRGNEIMYDTVGIIGYGHNGSLFAKKLQALGVPVVAYDKYKKDFDEPGIIACKDLSTLYEKANIISFHVPLTAETHNYFNDEFLANMRQPFSLLNLSRGGVVDLKTVVDGLESGKMAGAALDVWPYEPIIQEGGIAYQYFQQLIQYPNFIGTAHIGGYSHQATFKMSDIVAQKIKAMFA